MNSGPFRAAVVLILLSWFWPIVELVLGTYHIQQYGHPRVFWLCLTVALSQLVAIYLISNQKFAKFGVVVLILSSVAGFALPILRYVVLVGIVDCSAIGTP